MYTMNTEYYNWNTYINDRAIVEFEHEMGLQHNQINMNRYYVLSFLIKIFIKSGRKSNIITRYFDQEKYNYVSSSFVLNNLRLLKLKRRAFVKILEELEKHEYIIRYINHNQRFIKINNKLLEYYDKDFDLINKDPNIKNLSFRLGNIFAKTTDFQREDINRFYYKLKILDISKNN